MCGTPGWAGPKQRGLPPGGAGGGSACELPGAPAALPNQGQWILQLVTSRSQAGVGVAGLCCRGHSLCRFINLRTAIFKGLKSTLSLETPAHHNGGLFPRWGVTSSGGNVSGGGGQRLLPGLGPPQSTSSGSPSLGHSWCPQQPQCVGWETLPPLPTPKLWGF